MQRFRTIESAKEYAELNLGKNGSDIVDVNGKKVWICATSIPLERFRTPIETIVEEFLEEMGMEKEMDRLDIANFIGAEMSSKLIEMIEENSPYGIESSFMEF